MNHKNEKKAFLRMRPIIKVDRLEKMTAAMTRYSGACTSRNQLLCDALGENIRKSEGISSKKKK